MMFKKPENVIITKWLSVFIDDKREAVYHIESSTELGRMYIDSLKSAFEILLKGLEREGKIRSHWVAVGFSDSESEVIATRLRRDSLP